MEDFYTNHSGSIQIVGFVIAILGLYIAWSTYRKTYFSKPIEEKENLLALFRTAQALSLQLQSELLRYATDNDKMQSLIFEGISFEKYISTMKASYASNLSDQLYGELTRMDLSKSNIASMTKSIENQIEALNILQSNLKAISV